MSYLVPYDISGLKVGVLGDAHLGKRFLIGVPLHRRGEREETVKAAFHAALEEASAYEYVVQMGDIFDAFSIPNSLVLWTADTIEDVASRHPGVTFIFIKGNHDGARDATIKSSFDVLAALLRAVPNVKFVVNEPEMLFGALLILPWSPFKTAAEIAEQAIALVDGPAGAAFGHWDAESFGERTDNLIPSDILSKVTSLIISGHEHLARTFNRHGVRCDYVGSMLPYAHGEDAKDETYVTLTVAQISETPDAALRNKCVRVLLQPGETFDREIDCLQFQAVPVDAVPKDGQQIDIKVAFDNFDPNALFDQVMSEHEVPTPISTECRQRWQAEQDQKVL